MSSPRVLVLAVVLCAAARARAGVISGRVLADVDHSGDVTRGDTPVAGAVVVWEDRVFVRTDADGTFRTDAPGAGMIWVRGMDGFSPAPVWRSADDGASGIDLLVTPAPPPARPLRFVHVSDLHVGGVERTAVARALAQTIDPGAPPAFVVATGDLSQSSDPDELRAVKDLAAALPVPFVPGLGNHDWQDKGDAYRSVMGPPAYSFDAGGVHFIMLHGNATVADRLAFVQKDLALVPPGTPVYAFLHYPITLPYDDALYLGLIAAGVHHVFTGHYHANRTIAFPDLTDHNVQPLAMGGVQLVPAGYETVTVGDDGEPHTAPGFVVEHPVATIVAPPGDGGCVPPGDVRVVVAAQLGAGAPTVTATIDLDPAITLAPAGGWDYAGTAHVTAPGDHVITARVQLGDVVQTADARFCIADAPPPPLAIASSWPQLGGDARHRDAVDFTVAPTLATAWTATVGGYVLGGTPVLDRGRLFVPVADFGTDAHGGLVALDAATGRTLWEARIGSVVSAPAVDDDLVIVAAVDGVLRAYRVDTGALAWSYDLGAALPAQARGLYASPMIANGVVYAGQMYHFAALDARGGTPLWETHPSAAAFVDLSQSTPAADDDRVVGVFGHGVDGIRAYDAVDGASLWTQPDPLVLGMTAPPTLADPIGYFAAASGAVFSADLAAGTVGWHTTLLTGGTDYSFWLRAAPALAGDRLFVSSQLDPLFAIDPRDGSIKWRVPGGASILRTVSYRPDGPGASTSPIATGDLVWSASDGGTLRALRASDGKPRWSLELGVPVLAGPIPARTVAGDGVLFVASFDGTVRALVATGVDPDAPPQGCACASSGRAAPVLPVVAIALLRRRRRR